MKAVVRCEEINISGGIVRQKMNMVPHKTQRGAKAMERIKVFEGVPPPYDKTKRMVVPDCLKPICLQHGHRYCRLGDLSTQVGWKHEKAVAELEAKRLAKANKYYEQKKKLVAMRRKAEEQVKA